MGHRRTHDPDEVRAAAFAHLDELVRVNGPYLSRAQINTFILDGEPFALIEQKGIRKPSGWSTALSITSTGRSEALGGYEDESRPDGSVLYRYQRDSGPAATSTNDSLRAAAASGTPLIYFIEVAKGLLEPVFPVWIRAAEDNGVIVSEVPSGEYAQVIDIRRYVDRTTRHRLHQAEFRSRVLFAYADRCCICNLGRRGLLDAAHIVDDAHADGVASVVNGLAMCRIHHGAYDQFLIGIRPDHRIEVAHDVLQEVDGPMLRFGLQETDGATIVLPRQRQHQPDADKLEWKYERFRAATAS